MTQAALAKSLDLSPSYLNQLERDQRPLTIPVLLKLNSTFDLDVQFSRPTPMPGWSRICMRYSSMRRAVTVRH